MASKEDVLKEMFDIIDEAGKGAITLKQFLGAVDAMRPAHLKYTGEVFEVPKANEEDKLNLDEFQSNVLHLVERLGITLDQGLVKLKGGLIPEERALLMQLFDVVDIDEGGSITKDELREMMNVLQPGMNDQDILRLMLVADTDGGGDIDFDEFCTFMHQARIDLHMSDAIKRLADAFEKQREKLEQTKRAFEIKEVVAPAAKLTPAEAARLKRDRRKKNLADELSLEKLFAEEAKARKALEDEEDEAWASLSSGAGAALGDLSTAERIEREKDRERRRRDYLSGGRENQLSEITKMREKRRQEELEHNKEKRSEQRYQLEDRMAAQQGQMVSFGQQFKVLRQYLNKGTEFVRLEADREFSDLQKTIPKRNEEISSSLNRIESMLVTVGRALMQESMLVNGDGHKQVLKTFQGDPDFTWLSMQGGDQPSRQRSQNATRITAAHVNFSDTTNLHAEVDPVPMQMTMKELKKYLWATYRYYQSTEEGITFLDWQKLIGDVKVEVAGSVSVLWANALRMKEHTEVLGLQGVCDMFLQQGMLLENDEVSVPDRVDFHQFSNLLLVLACERHIASDTVEPPLHLLNSTRVQSIPILLEEHLEVLEPFVAKVRQDIAKYMSSRQFSQKAVEAESRVLEGSVLGVGEFLPSMDLMIARHAGRLPKIALSQGAKDAVRRLQGDRGYPVLPVKEVTNYLVNRASVVGRPVLREVVTRGLREIISSTYPLLPLPNLNADSSLEAVPFPMFLALCCRISSYTSVAAATPPPPTPQKHLTLPSQSLYNFMHLLTHPGHYVLTL